MILISLLLMQAAYAPETEAVMNRSREKAEQQRAEQAKATQPKQATPAGLPLPPEAAAKLQACLDVAINDPEAGVRFAQDWALDGGGFSASQCRGFAEARAGRWQAAMGAFEAAANQAQKAGSARDAARLLAQAGNAALADGNA